MRKIKKSFMALVTLCFFVTSMFLVFVDVKANAEELKNVSVRIEGLESIIVQGNSKGNTAWEAIKQLLDNKKISYKIANSKFGIYIEEINGLKAGKFNQYDGWMFYIKEGNKIVEPSTSIGDYKLKDRESIVVYYGAFGVTDICNKIKFEPEVVKADKDFKMQFLYKHFDYNQNKDIEKLISNVKVNIDNKKYTTNKDGFIEVEGLAKGKHSFKISGYEKDNVPKVVMEKGNFNIDGISPTKINFVQANIVNNEDDNEIKNNDSKNVNNKKEEKKVNFNINKDYEETLNYLKSKDASPWVGFSLYKAGVKFNSTFLKDLDNELENQPINETRPAQLETDSIGLASLGYSPLDYKNNNLVKELYSRNIDDFFTNELIFGLLTHRALNLKDEYNITRKDLVNKILSNKLTNNNNGKDFYGWAWTGNKIDIDMTAATINALAPYYNGEKLEGIDNNKVRKAVDEAIETLSYMQKDTGDIVGEYGPSSENDSFVIMALTSIGINPAGQKFTKTKGNLVTALLSYKGDNGQFNHNKEVKNNYLSTDEAFRALICLKNFDGKNTVDYYKSNINLKDLKLVNADGSIKENKKDNQSVLENKDNNLNNKNVTENKNNNLDSKKENNLKTNVNQQSKHDLENSNELNKEKIALDKSKQNDDLKEEIMPTTGSRIGYKGFRNISIAIISLGILVLYKGKKGE